MNACDDLVNAGLLADGGFAVRALSPVSITTRTPMFAQLADGLRAVRLDDVRHGDDAEQLSVLG